MSKVKTGSATFLMVARGRHVPIEIFVQRKYHVNWKVAKDLFPLHIYVTLSQRKFVDDLYNVLI